MRPGTVLVLNGTSSSGKTSLARALQERWDGPLLDAGLDRHLGMLPRRYLAADWPQVYAYDLDGAGVIRAVTTGPVGRRLVEGMHRSVAALARAGHDVVLDHVLLDARTARDLAIALEGVPAVLVGVRLPLDVLRQREADRRERTIGQAEAQHAQVHTHGGYDVEVDTSWLSPDEAAESVLGWLESGTPQALAALREGVAGTLQLRPLAADDLPLLGRWLAEEQVRRWWNHDPTPEGVERDFGASVRGEEKGEDWVVLLDGEPVGLVQRAFVHDYDEDLDDFSRALDVPRGAVEIDYLIGEPRFRGRGLGARLIRHVVERTWADLPAATDVVVAVVAANEASWRAVERAGLPRVAEVDIEPDNPVDPPLHYVYRVSRP